MFDLDVLYISSPEEAEALGVSHEDDENAAALCASMVNQRVSDVPRGPAITLPPDASVGAALAAMRRDPRGAAVVVRGQAPLGVITDRDILMHAGGDIDSLQSVPVSALMAVSPEPLRETDSVAKALRSMCAQRRWHLPIVCKRNLLIGAIDVADLSMWFRDRLTLASVETALGLTRV